MTMQEWKNDFKDFLKYLIMPRDDYNSIISYIDDVPCDTANKWISVKDRFPCDGVFVLVCNDDGHMMIAKYESEAVRWEYKYTNYDWDVWDDDEQGPVCYWAYLPEPPKEEG